MLKAEKAVSLCLILLDVAEYTFFFVLCTCIIMLYALAVKIARFSNANHLRFARWRWLPILWLLPFLFILWTCTLLNFIFSELYILVIVVNFVEDAKCWLSGFWYSRCFFPKKCILSIFVWWHFPIIGVYERASLVLRCALFVNLDYRGLLCGSVLLAIANHSDWMVY